MKVTEKGHIFYITNSNTLKLLRFKSQIPRKITSGVMHRANGKSFKSKENFIIVQEDDYTILKYDVSNVDRIKSQKLRISTHFGEIADFQFLAENNWLVVLTSKGSIQILDGRRKCSCTHRAKKLSSKP